jgi:hypothetical protein
MLEKLVGLSKLTIHQCEELAKKYDGDTAFDLCGPLGRKRATWLDPHMGLFKIDGSDGFVMVKDFAFIPDIWCENLVPTDLDKPVESTLSGSGDK